MNDNRPIVVLQYDKVIVNISGYRKIIVNEHLDLI